MLLDEQVKCPAWLMSSNDQLPDRYLESLSLDSALKARKDAENALNIWTELSATDLTDALAGAVMRLTSSIRRLQVCMIEHCGRGARFAIIDEIFLARLSIRQALSLPPEDVDVMAPVRVSKLEMATSAMSGSNTEGNGADWRIIVDGKTYTLVSTTGSSSVKLDDKPESITDQSDPVIWTTQRVELPEGGAEFAVKVYRLRGGSWKVSIYSHVRQIAVSDARLDLLYLDEVDLNSGGPLKWTWLAPNMQATPISVLRYRGSLASTCASKNALWLNMSTDTSNVLVKMVISVAQTAIPLEVLSPQLDFDACNDDAVAYNGYRSVCVDRAGCTELEFKRGTATRLMGRQLVTVDVGDVSDPKRGQLLALRVSDGTERIFRLPPGTVFARLGANSTESALLLFDTQGRSIELPWPLAS